MNSIYKDNLISVFHPAESGVPGLLAIQPIKQKTSISELNDVELRLFTYMQRTIRAGLKTLFNVDLCGLYCEEHPHNPVTSYTIPFHISRLAERYSTDVYQPYIEEYIKSYSISGDREQINKFNSGLAEMLANDDIQNDIQKIKNGVKLAETIKEIPNPTEQNAVPEIESTLEVFDETELPPVPKGKKYFVCIGGDKNFQGFLRDNSISKGEFISIYEDKLDDCLKPVYEDNQIIVRQDAKYAIPGFYIVSPKSHYQRIDEMPDNLFHRCMETVREVKEGLSKLEIESTHIYHDEKYKSPASVHFWVLPIYEKQIREQSLNPTIFSKDIWTYLDSFPRFKETKSKILEINSSMKQSLNA